MKIILQQVFIADPGSPYNGNKKDILITDGIIQKIDDNITEDSAQYFNGKDITVSPGWVDIFANACDPGYEFRETLESCADAAAAGGYTTVFTLPDTLPFVDNKAQVEYVKQKSASLKIDIRPLGGISKKQEGKELAEMYDMQHSGAIAFTDGLNPVQNHGLFLKALQYVKSFNGVIIQLPRDKSINASGLINEGVISTRLGLPGIPAIAEELIIARDIELAQYTESNLHFTGITTERSVQLIKAAKQKGINVSCSVTPYHLFFCDEDVQSYNTNLKVNPPLRSKKDMHALRQAVLDGDIDCIASHHLPEAWDDKTCEFQQAKWGMIGLQTAYAAVKTAIPSLSAENICNLFSLNARRIFGLESATIMENQKATLTLFNTSGFILQKEKIKSRSYNSAFINIPLQGNVVGIFSKDKLISNN
ncbi:MAG: dihydroorotase [Bacteroidetes bacterium]|nr:dihydroorotase [Bacteroidota bacterium]